MLTASKVIIGDDWIIITVKGERPAVLRVEFADDKGARYKKMVDVEINEVLDELKIKRRKLFKVSNVDETEESQLSSNNGRGV